MTFTPQTMMPVILQRLAGSLTAAQAAKQLKISRKTYYQWESRALQGMQTALSLGQPGRPPTKRNDPLSLMKTQNQQLQQQVEVLEQRLRIREIMASAETRTKKK